MGAEATWESCVRRSGVFCTRRRPISRWTGNQWLRGYIVPAARWFCAAFSTARAAGEPRKAQRVPNTSELPGMRGVPPPVARTVRLLSPDPNLGLAHRRGSGNNALCRAPSPHWLQEKTEDQVAHWSRPLATEIHRYNHEAHRCIDLLLEESHMH